jgi:hypothetical protein
MGRESEILADIGPQNSLTSTLRLRIITKPQGNGLKTKDAGAALAELKQNKAER